MNRAAGAASTVKIKGETFILSPLTPPDFGLIENHLLQNRPNLLRMAIEAASNLPKGTSQDVIDRMFDRVAARAEKSKKVSQEEVAEWLDTRDGIAFTVWIMLEKKHAGRFKLEEMNQIIQDMEDGEVADVMTARDAAGHFKESPKNGEGQAPAVAEAAA